MNCSFGFGAASFEAQEKVDNAIDALWDFAPLRR
jgi:hypothetical protein